MTETFYISVQGEDVEVKVKEFSALEKIVWAARAPEDLRSSIKNQIPNPESINYMISVTVSQTNLTRELINELDEHEIARLLGGAVSYAFGKEPNIEYRSTKEEDKTIEFGEDGFVDLEDWR